MVKDASQGISFICNNIAEYGGDPNRYFIHLFALLSVDSMVYLSNKILLPCLVHSLEFI